MSDWVWLAGFVVVIAWAVAAFTIWRWGPGRARRPVFCPEQHIPTHVVAVRSEMGFGTLRTSDIVQCDLLGPGPVTCGKRCLARL